MINSIPLSAVELGIDFEEYEKIAWNIRRMSMISRTARQEVLERAQEAWPLEKRIKILKLGEDMADDRAVYKIAGLNYADGPPQGEKLFITAVADYLLVGRFFS